MGGGAGGPSVLESRKLHVNGPSYRYEAPSKPPITMDRLPVPNAGVDVLTPQRSHLVALAENAHSASVVAIEVRAGERGDFAGAHRNKIGGVA